MPADAPFIDLLMAGSVTGDDLERFVERWHTAGDDEVPLHEHLGLTWQEYHRLGAGDHGLDDIVRARRQGGVG